VENLVLLGVGVALGEVEACVLGGVHRDEVALDVVRGVAIVVVDVSARRQSGHDPTYLSILRFFVSHDSTSSLVLGISI
jgi:hypothetical protein